MFVFTGPTDMQTHIEQRLRKEAAEGARYRDFKHKDELRKFLFERQGHRCAYCERPVSLKQRGKKNIDHAPGRPPSTKIEHFHPKSLPAQGKNCMTYNDSHSPGFPLALPNLLLVCSGSTASETHCDTRKDNQDVCDTFLSPLTLDPTTDPARWSLVLINRDGRATPNPVIFNTETAYDAANSVLNDVLNVNLDRLVELRRTRYAEFIKEFAKSRRAHFKHHSRQSISNMKETLSLKMKAELLTENPAFPSVQWSFMRAELS